MADTLLEMKGVTKRFGGLTAVDSFEARLTSDDQVVGLIGPNGAGKTTVFNLVTGVYDLTEGTIEVGGTNTAGMSPDRIIGLGIARTFQNIRLFKEMTVLDNVKTAMGMRRSYGLMAAILRTRRFRLREKEIEDQSLELLKILGLEDDAGERAASLPYGEQRRLEIARALATDPKLLILDEPAAGMNPQETEELAEMLHAIRQRFSLTLLLIEHDMKFVMNICERIIVLDYGKIIARGTPGEVRENPDVIAAYLGDAADGVKLGD